MSDRQHPQWLADDLARSQPERDAWNARLRADAEREAEARAEMEAEETGRLLREADEHALAAGRGLVGSDYRDLVLILARLGFVTWDGQMNTGYLDVGVSDIDALLGAIADLPAETRERLARLIAPRSRGHTDERH